MNFLKIHILVHISRTVRQILKSSKDLKSARQNNTPLKFASKIIWSREVENGRDYEPLALDDTRLISDTRINPTRLVINKQSNDFIQWNLVINNLKLSDSNSYICQLNQKPYDIQWLKKFTLNVYGSNIT